MQVYEILRQKGDDVATVSPDATVATAVESLRQWGVGALVVTTDGTTIEGIVSERDIVRGLGGPHRTLLDQTVATVMKTEIFKCSPTDRVEHLMALMTNNRVPHLPVAVEGKLVGIISIGDVVKSRLTELENETRAMEDYIHNGR